MVWFNLIIIILSYIIWKFNSDSKKKVSKNESFGGQKKMFPEFAQYFEDNGFELVENSGERLLYKKVLTTYPPFDKYLLLVIKSNFANIAFGYVINESRKKTRSNR